MNVEQPNGQTVGTSKQQSACVKFLADTSITNTPPIESN